MRIGSLSLGVSDPDASADFYGGALGLDVQREGDDLFVRWPDFLLTLTKNPPAGRGKFHFGFCVDSREEVDAWARRVRERGGQVVSGPAEQSGRYQLFFLDPDSYEIEIFSE